MPFLPTAAPSPSPLHDRLIRLYDTATAELVTVVKGHSGPAEAVAFSPDGRSLASAGGVGDVTVRLWDARTGQLRLALSGHSLRVTNVAFSPTGDTIASADSEGKLRVWLTPAPENADTPSRIAP